MYPIGIDVERRFPWKEKLAQRSAHPQEYRDLKALPVQMAHGGAWDNLERKGELPEMHRNRTEAGSSHIPGMVSGYDGRILPSGTAEGQGEYRSDRAYISSMAVKLSLPDRWPGMAVWDASDRRVYTFRLCSAGYRVGDTREKIRAEDMSAPGSEVFEAVDRVRYSIE